ncbi:MAG: NAD(P)/FAD-dependent oxidoreductase [Burkholderiales bacterium]
MLRLNEIKLPLGTAREDNVAALRAAALARLKIADGDLLALSIYRRGYDARKKAQILLVYTLDVEVKNEAAVLKKLRGDPKVVTTPDTSYKFVAHAPKDFNGTRPVVIGLGPCGLFAALTLAQMGFKPILLERGKAVRERTQDTWGLWRKSTLNPESNVQFGEGGAGTFSDGKLWSQIKDPYFLTRKVLTEFVEAGAPPEILYVSKPHIGTFKLVSMVEVMRAKIIALGGEIRFQHRAVDFEIECNDDARQLRGVTVQHGDETYQLRTDHLVLAIGHSARDTFYELHERGVFIEPKPFSIGFRIEHPQGLIDRARFGPNAGNQMLGAADYKLVHHASNGRSVYSFCMCPGGTVVAATSEVGRVVTNGMSQYSRNERNANAGIVVGISPAKDYPEHVLAGVDFQRKWETAAFHAGGENYNAPAQLVGDFLERRASTELGSVLPSYKPGVKMTDLSLCVPAFVIDAVREALPEFDKHIPGFAMHDAVLTGVETRTSSPIRISRRDDNFQSVNTAGLFPAGEGAGYAGGIMSAGVDGIKIAEAVALSMLGGKVATRHKRAVLDDPLSPY